MSNREGTSKERERRKRAVDEMRAKLKKDLEKTVARPRRYVSLSDVIALQRD